MDSLREELADKARSLSAETQAAFEPTYFLLLASGVSLHGLELRYQLGNRSERKLLRRQVKDARREDRRRELAFKHFCRACEVVDRVVVPATLEGGDLS